MARVHVLTDDLMFGSRLQADLVRADHEVTMGMTADPSAELIVADLTHDPEAALAALGAMHPPTLGFFSHVQPAVRERALAAGIDVVVPRSRIAREAPALVAALAATAR
jgi:hydrogenase maturation factor